MAVHVYCGLPQMQWDCYSTYSFLVVHVVVGPGRFNCCWQVQHKCFTVIQCIFCTVHNIVILTGTGHAIAFNVIILKVYRRVNSEQD